MVATTTPEKPSPQLAVFSGNMATSSKVPTPTSTPLSPALPVASTNQPVQPAPVQRHSARLVQKNAQAAPSSPSTIQYSSPASSVSTGKGKKKKKKKGKGKTPEATSQQAKSSGDKVSGASQSLTPGSSMSHAESDTPSQTIGCTTMASDSADVSTEIYALVNAPFKVGDNTLRVYVDTLSTFSLISRSLWDSVRDSDLWEPDCASVETSDKTLRPGSVATVNGSSSIIAVGSLLVDGLPRTRLKVKVRVVDCLPMVLGPCALILGIQALRKLGASIDLGGLAPMVCFSVANISLPLIMKPGDWFRDHPGCVITTVGSKLENLPKCVRSTQEDCYVDDQKLSDADFEKYIDGMDDDRLRRWVADRFVGYVPKTLDFKLKPGVTPKQFRPYTIRPDLRHEADELIKTLADEGKLVPATWSLDEYISPVFVIRKRSGKLRLLVDLRSLNYDINLDPPSSIPHLYESVVSLPKTSKFFSVDDLKDAYWDHEVAPHCRKLLTICLWDRTLWQFVGAPQGLSLSPESFCDHVWDLLLTALGLRAYRFYRVYIDDIATHGPSPESVRVRRRLLHFIMAYFDKAFSVKGPVEEVPQTSVDFCGLTLSSDGVSMSRTSVETLEKVLSSPPSTKKDLRSALGTIQYHRSGFARPELRCSEFGTLLSVLYDKLQQRWKWTDDDQSVWDRVRSLYTNQPLGKPTECMPLPSDGVWLLVSDSSDSGIGGLLLYLTGMTAELLSELPGEELIHRGTLIGVWSGILDSLARRWLIYDREMFALITGWKKYWRFLYASIPYDRVRPGSSSMPPVIFMSDNSVVCSRLCTMKIDDGPGPRVTRWLSWLEDLAPAIRLHAVVRHLAGPANDLADLLSRAFVEPVDNGQPAQEGSVALIAIESFCSVAEMVRRTEGAVSDTYCSVSISDIYSSLVEGGGKEQVKSLARSRFTLDSNGLLFYIDAAGNRSLYVPPDCVVSGSTMPMRQYLIYLVHEHHSHAGIAQTYFELRIRYWWPSLRKHVFCAISACNDCALVRSHKQARQVGQDFHRFLARRFDTVAVDLAAIPPQFQANHGNTIL
ncbi:hypothetical protein FOZ63_002019, partial [Perkinsus olseni]